MNAVTLQKKGDRYNVNYSEFICDTLADRNEIDVNTIAPSSIAKVLDDNGEATTYMLNTKKEWVKVNLSSGSGEGVPGLDGKSAYEYAVEQGYTGTEEEFGKRMVQAIPSTLKELSSDPAHRTVTDEQIQKWNNNQPGEGGTFSGTANDFLINDTTNSKTYIAKFELLNGKPIIKYSEQGGNV